MVIFSAFQALLVMATVPGMYNFSLEACSETLVMHLGVQKIGIISIFLSWNDMVIGGCTYSSDGTMTCIVSTKNLTFDSLGGCKITLHNISSSDSGNYRCGITFDSGLYTKIDWHLTFYDEPTPANIFTIKLQKNNTTSVHHGGRKNIKYGHTNQNYTCNNATVDCFIMSETFKCIQTVPQVCSVKDRTVGVDSQSQMHGVVLVVVLSVLAVILLALVVGCIVYKCRRHRRQQEDTSEDGANEKLKTDEKDKMHDTNLNHDLDGDD